MIPVPQLKRLAAIEGHVACQGDLPVIIADNSLAPDEAAVILAARGFAPAVNLPYSVASVIIRRLCAVNGPPAWSQNSTPLKPASKGKWRRFLGAAA